MSHSLSPHNVQMLALYFVHHHTIIKYSIRPPYTLTLLCQDHAAKPPSFLTKSHFRVLICFGMREALNRDMLSYINTLNTKSTNYIQNA